VKVVEVIWRDHANVHGWAENLAAPSTVQSVGYLAHETEEYYVLLSGQADTGSVEPYNCSLAILKVNVLAVKELARSPEPEDGTDT
jgi:hypothetical protein